MYNVVSVQNIIEFSFLRCNISFNSIKLLNKILKFDKAKQIVIGIYKILIQLFEIITIIIWNIQRIIL